MLIHIQIYIQLIQRSDLGVIWMNVLCQSNDLEPIFVSGWTAANKL